MYLEYEMGRSQTTIELNAYPFVDPISSGVLLVMRDVTKLRKLENHEERFRFECLSRIENPFVLHSCFILNLFLMEPLTTLT